MVKLILSVIGKERTGRRTVRKEKCTCSIPCQFPPYPAGFNLKVQVQLEVLRLGLGLDLQEL